VYYDDKGVLRKETSWEGWRDNKIEPIEFENIPRSGYMINKGIQRDGYHWGNGRSVIRVYDPRDFEFEITVDNLIGILMHSDVSKRDIAEKCVFAWDGKELVLLPVNSEIYEASVNFTKKQAETFSARSLVKGYTYNQKKYDTPLIYIGYFDWYDWNDDVHFLGGRDDTSFRHKNFGKKHIFYGQSKYGDYCFMTPGIQTFSSVLSEEVAENYASLVDKFFKTPNSQPFVDVKMKTTFEKYNNNTHRYNLYKQNGLFVEKAYFDDYIYGKLISGDYIHKKLMYAAEMFPHNLLKYKFEFINDNTTISAHMQSIIDKTGSFKKQMMDKSAEMGYNSNELTLEQTLEVYKAEGFGTEIVLVLKNGIEVSRFL
jgi:hypothetical protein